MLIYLFFHYPTVCFVLNETQLFIYYRNYFFNSFTYHSVWFLSFFIVNKYIYFDKFKFTKNLPSVISEVFLRTFSLKSPGYLCSSILQPFTMFPVLLFIFKSLNSNIFFSQSTYYFSIKNDFSYFQLNHIHISICLFLASLSQFPGATLLWSISNSISSKSKHLSSHQEYPSISAFFYSF